MLPPRRRSSPFAELWSYAIGLVAPLGSLLLALALTLGDLGDTPAPRNPIVASAPAAAPVTSVDVAGAQVAAVQPSAGAQALPGDSLSTRLPAAPSSGGGAAAPSSQPALRGGPGAIVSTGPLIGQVGGATPPLPFALAGLGLTAAGIALRRGFKPGWHGHPLALAARLPR